MKFIKGLFSGEVFFILFILSGFYKGKFMEIFVLDPTVLFFALSMLSAVFRVYKRGYLIKASIVPLCLYASILILIICSLYVANGNPYSYDKAIKFATITAWSFAGVFFLTNFSDPIKSLKRYLYTFLGVGIAMVLDVLIGNNTEESGFMTALGSNYIALGRMMGMSSLIIMSYLILKKHNFRKNVLLISLSAVFVYVMFLAGGRMPVISFLICLFLLILSGVKITGFDITNIRFKKRTLLFGITLVLALPFLLLYLSKSDLTFVYRFMDLLSSDGDTSRTAHFGRAWNMLFDTNLLGSGIGNYSAQLVAEVSYPHNIFLEFASELGLIGLLLFTTLVLLGLIHYFKNFSLRHDFYSAIILLLFIFNFAAANVAGDINDNRIMFFSLSLLFLSEIFKNGLVDYEKRKEVYKESNVQKPKKKYRVVW